MADPILEVSDIATYFDTDEGTVKAVDGVSFSVEEEETLGIVGESGSGKSVTALSIMRLIDNVGRIDRGEIYYRGEDLIKKSEQQMRDIRGQEIAMIFQDPMTSLNPVFTISRQITRILRAHRGLSKSEARAEAIELLDQVGIPNPEERIDNYPHQFSGGMRQRVLIAMAISCNPSVLIADEPTTALDVTIEAQIFDLLNDIQDEYGMSIILITHDLGVVAGTCDNVAVMYGGRIVEKSDINEIFHDPRHPYTRGLLRSLPNPGGDVDELETIKGSVPNPVQLPPGCSFHPRCPHAVADCREYDPELREVTPAHEAACIRAEGYDLNPEQTTRDGVVSDGGDQQ